MCVEVAEAEVSQDHQTDNTTLAVDKVDKAAVAEVDLVTVDLERMDQD